MLFNNNVANKSAQLTESFRFCANKVLQLHMRVTELTVTCGTSLLPSRFSAVLRLFVYSIDKVSSIFPSKVAR